MSTQERIEKIALESVRRKVAPADTKEWRRDPEFGRRNSKHVWDAVTRRCEERNSAALESRRITVTTTTVIDDTDDDPPDDMGRDFRLPEEDQPMAVDNDEDECDEDDDDENGDDD
jgi:hypothetical protein